MVRIIDTVIYQANMCPPEWLKFEADEVGVTFYASDDSACAHRGWFAIPNYSSDLEVWTSELYQWIESEGLHVRFLIILMEITMLTGVMLPAWAMCSSTPTQKASALYRAIKERG